MDRVPSRGPCSANREPPAPLRYDASLVGCTRSVTGCFRCLTDSDPVSERTAKRTARHSLQSLCIPEFSAHPRNATNTNSANRSVSGGFPPILAGLRGSLTNRGERFRLALLCGFRGLCGLCAVPNQGVSCTRNVCLRSGPTGTRRLLLRGWYPRARLGGDGRHARRVGLRPSFTTNEGRWDAAAVHRMTLATTWSLPPPTGRRATER
jgi:hypothetical protein